MASNYKAATDLKVKHLVHNLITYEAAIPENTKNFSIAFDFMLSNLKQHSYPNPEYQAVFRTYQGCFLPRLSEKLRINSQNEKADYLDHLVTDLKEKWKTRDPDLLASVLSLLLHLSDSPLKSDLDYSKEPTVGESVAKFIEESRAAEFQFTEDETKDLFPSWADEETSEEESLSSDSQDVEMQESTESAGKETEEKVDNSNVRLLTAMDDVDALVYGAFPHPYAFSQVSSPANPVPAVVSESSPQRGWLDPNSLCAEYYNDSFYLSLSPGSQVTESALLSDILCMLLGIDTDYFIYDSGYRPKLNFEVSHLTPPALRSILRQFCTLGTGIRTLQQFSETQKSTESLVFRSFAQGIDLFLYRETELINELAGQVAVQAGVVPPASIDKLADFKITLISLWEALQSTSQTVQLMLATVKNGVNEVGQGGKPEESISSAYRASYLLSYLFYLLQENVSSTDPASTHLISTLFRAALHPMIGLLCDWMAAGGTGKFPEEFFAGVVSLGAGNEFLIWEKGFEIKTQLIAGDKTKCCPSFLEDLTDTILSTAKTMRVVRKLEEEVTAAEKLRSSVHSLKEKMLQRLTETLGEIPSSSYLKSELVDWRPGTERRKMLPDADFPPIFHLSEIRPELFPSPYLMEVDPQSHPLGEKFVLPRTKEYSWVSFSHVIKYAVSDPLKTAHSEVVTHLLSLLDQHLRLDHYFSLIRSIYLMESGEFTTPFLAQMFLKLEQEDVLNSDYELNLAFHEVFQGWKWAGSLDVFRFTLESDPSPAISLEATTHIQLQFDPPHPLDLIFDQETMYKYEALFRFLVQVKRAIYSVSDVKWQERVIIRPHHPFVLFQGELRHFIHSFEVYLFQQILTVGAYKFQSLKEKAKSVDEIRNLHKVYLDKMIERCLLSQKTLPIYKAVCSVFECCISFRHLVRRLTSLSPGIADYLQEVRECEHVLGDLQEHFKRSNWFLIQILSKQAQRKMAVHCNVYISSDGSLLRLEFQRFLPSRRPVI